MKTTKAPSKVEWKLRYKRGETLFSSKDIYLFDVIKDNPDICVGELRNTRKVEITSHSNVIPHLKRLEKLGLVYRTRKKQSIHLNIVNEEDVFVFVNRFRRLYSP